MRLFAVLLICILPFAVVPTQAEPACLCANEAATEQSDQMDQMDWVACCQSPLDCCWQGGAQPGQAVDWLLTLKKVEASPTRFVVANLALPELLCDRGCPRALATLHPPPPSARALRTAQQSWLI